MTREKDQVDWGGGTVSAIWHHPEGGSGTYVVLGHGAGGNMHTPQLAAYGDALAARGVGAVRFNFPYTEAKRKGADPPARLQACCRAVAERVAARADRLLLGGRSLGGRMASHVVADGFACAGLIFLAYPLHRPGNTDHLRDAHLRGIGVPMLFFSGTRDSFARFDLLAATLEKLPHSTLHVLENADHGFKIPGRAPDEIVTEITERTLSWLEEIGEKRRSPP